MWLTFSDQVLCQVCGEHVWREASQHLLWVDPDGGQHPRGYPYTVVCCVHAVKHQLPRLQAKLFLRTGKTTWHLRAGPALRSLWLRNMAGLPVAAHFLSKAIKHAESVEAAESTSSDAAASVV